MIRTNRGRRSYASLKRHGAALLMLCGGATAPQAQAQALAALAPASAMRLYTLDCGQLDIDDMTMFSDTGEHAGEHGTMAVPCFLVKHGDRWMLWDTGLGDRLAASPGGERVFPGELWTVRRTLVSQLAALGLTPADIDYVALSHLHADHTSNLDLFAASTILINGKELAWARGGKTTANPKAVAFLATAKVDPITGDRDVFGDGRVRIIATPGHTPGHSSLLLDLARSGRILISGDLYHSRENYEHGLVPGVNVSRAETLASFDRVNRMAKRLGARVYVQHSREDYATLPKPPAFLD